MKKRYKSKIFHFCDDVINNSYGYLEGLCHLFIKNKLNISWAVYAKVNNLDRYILRKMKEAGCLRLMFGVESGSDNILKKMNKGFTIEQAINALKDASELGLKNSIYLITGYPHETQEDIEQTINFIRKNKKYIYNVKIYEFYLTSRSLIYYNPEKYGVMNLRLSQPRFRFAFDECVGLKWEQKQRQQEDSERQIVKAVHKNIQLNNRRYKAFLFYPFTLLRFIIIKIKNVCHLI